MKALILLVTFLGAASGCAVQDKGTPPSVVGYTETGIASFYAAKYQFRQTANGERFNHLAKTAAHKTLPFGTRLSVTNRENGKSVIVRVNDRGPFIDGRIVDLTRAAFSSIADTSKGVVPVTIEAIP
ncbi:septal ring lytic transglycosylase RlpA family protein [Luminiphilus syltensis]|uniref:septal ring lytic transglycosylase RlpA family protein n=1 Tax=Luminiphilus syltensis TaxID=1341119 RepID=UPI000683802E|nr:septal ring lytic transglycosylase RlpA family protein [Luminiphilus syltensis]